MELVDVEMRRQLRDRLHSALAEQGISVDDVRRQVTAGTVLRYLWLERPDLAYEVSAGKGYRWLEKEVGQWKEVLFGNGAMAR